MQEIYVRQIKELQQRLETAESRLSEVEECDCSKSCRAPGGVVREDGSTWSEGCQICSCVHGEISCRQPQCPALNCTDPNPPDPSLGLCCPTCKAECRRFGVSIPHGATYRPSACAACECSDGRLHCD